MFHRMLIRSITSPNVDVYRAGRFLAVGIGLVLGGCGYVRPKFSIPSDVARVLDAPSEVYVHRFAFPIEG